MIPRRPTSRALFFIVLGTLTLLSFPSTLPAQAAPESRPASRVVRIQEVNPTEVRERLKRMRAWFLKNQEATGAMRYVVGPVGQRQFEANNMIRQWMTTWALFELADFLGDAEFRKAAEKNLAFNAANYLRVEPEKGIAYVFGEDSAKLGAAAFALMSLRQSREFPEREARMQDLLRFILGLQNADGSFRTFYLPADRNDNQNFYPGEAALALAIVEGDAPGKDPRIKPALKNAFRYYREFFRKTPNPAFIPWWTQALYRLDLLEPAREYREFIFEMNDFLIAIQNTPKQPKTPGPLGQGHFYDPKFSMFGPPHASSTAVYAEGLTDALKLAKRIGDPKRAREYAYAVRWAIRSLFQLQYDEATARGLAMAEFLPGGIRSAEERWEIRVDNVQHAAMMMMNLFAEKSVWPAVAQAR